MSPKLITCVWDSLFLTKNNNECSSGTYDFLVEPCQSFILQQSLKQSAKNCKCSILKTVFAELCINKYGSFGKSSTDDVNNLIFTKCQWKQNQCKLHYWKKR